MVYLKFVKKIDLVLTFLTTIKFYLFIFIFFISWRLITLEYCSEFCHTLNQPSIYTIKF